MPSPSKSGLGSSNFMATKNISNLSEDVFNKFESKVTAPRNPKLIKTTEKTAERMTPSMYLHEMSMDTDKKLADTHNMRLPRIVELLDMSETTHQKVSYVDVEEAMFQPFPSEMYFQNFEPFRTHELPLLLRNNDKVPRLVKVVQNDSPYFKIISPDDVSHKVAPGMASVFKIQFTPEDRKDYQHELICMTEREKFIVPVQAIGARAILDFPDEVNFGICPVKHNSSKILFVRNIGNREAKCTFTVDEPFAVSSASGNLAVGDSMQATLEFKPVKVGDHQKDLILKYDTGENIYVTLYGASIDANVRLDKSTLRVDNTYISMANQRAVTIHNRSDVMAHFKWSPFATRSEEDSQKESFCAEVNEEEEQEKERFLSECALDPTLRDRLSILTRTFKNRRNLIVNDPILFNDETFNLYPLEGDIWPNSTAEITIVFKPTVARSYQQTVFCDITGRESRLPLKIRGDGLGPKLVFSFDSLDIGNVFASSTHNYEVILVNKGDIDAIFNLVPVTDTKSRFHEFQFDPVEGIVLPDGHQAIEITFRSECLGSFSQDFYFSVDGTPEPLKLTVKANVIGPTFHFDVPRLRFGTVSYGFNHTKICTLINTSLVPMTFILRIPDDGKGEPSISSMSDLSDGLLSTIGLKAIKSPQEFDITPAQGIIRPQSEAKIHVTLCSNTLKRYDCSLVVDVKGVGKNILTLPITAKTVVPSIQVMMPQLHFGRCFINHSYQLKAKLANDSDLPAKYDLQPQVREDLTAIMFGSSAPKGLIEPHSMVEVPILIQVLELDEQETTAYFTIFGSPDQPLSLLLNCIGEGPVVHITPESLNWGQVEVLVPNVKTVELSNESLIPADFIAQMMRPDSIWKLDPEQGTIPPESVMHVTVTAVLDDCIRFQDKLTVSVVKGPLTTIPVQAYGYGTTIVIEPPLAPAISLGPHFAKSKFVRRFKLINRGRRHQSLTWTSDGFAKPKARRDTINFNPKDMKYRNLAAPPASPEPVFRLQPSRLALESGQSAWVTLEGICDTPKQVTETLLCHAIIGKANGKERIMRATVRADFISPVLELSKERIDFRVDKRPDDVTALTPQNRTFAIRNVSSLPLTCILRVSYPFQLLDFYGSPQSVLEVNLAMGQDLEMTVRFDPAFKDDLVSRVAEGEVIITYREHPHSDFIKLRGEVNFPNLDFNRNDIDFGCILNDTEVARFLDITNTSPLPVSYRWSFLVVEGEQNIRYIGEILPPEPEPVLPDEPIAKVNLHDNAPQLSDATIQEEAKEKQSAVEITSSHPEQAPDERIEENKEVNASESNQENKEKDSEEENETKADGSTDQVTSDHDETTDLGLSVEWSKEDMTQHGEIVERVIEEERTRSLSRLSSRHQPSHPVNTRINELPLLPWLEPGASHVPNGVEEVFDILPLYGTLEPGETQRVTFTYYGHADVSCNARAICEVQGGPKYEVKLQGEASLIEYKFDKAIVDFGKQMFDQAAGGELILRNTGRVGFNFTGMTGLGEKDPTPGIPTLKPNSGYVPAFEEVVLRVHYLPGVPEKFHKSFEIQIAHFEPTIISVLGEGVFPRLSLDLPRFTEHDEHYASLLKEAKENLEHETVKHEHSGVSTPQKRKEEDESQFHLTEDLPSDLEIQMEVERLLLRDFASENQHFFSGIGIAPDPSAKDKAKKKRKFPRVRLTDYVLDFGYVVLGNVRSHIVRATNTSHSPVSFSADRSGLHNTGFNVELDRVKQLPGHPDHETVDFKITFDPRGVNLWVGPVEAMIPINIVNGPQLCVRLRAHVAVPELSVSSDVVDFESVQCGQCKVVTVQLHNEQHVRCEWTSINPDSNKVSVDKHIPMHLRRKIRRENKPKPNHFEMMPAQGFLAPGQRMNVQIKFMPTEARLYSQRMMIHIMQGTSRVSISVRGEGQEARLEFEPNLVEFGPILPHGPGDEVDVTVRNPTPLAVEFYSLNFDKQFLKEEKILRMMKGYDEHGNLLLPPRIAGEDMPPELLQFFQEFEEKADAAKQKADTEATKTEGEDATETDDMDPENEPSSNDLPHDDVTVTMQDDAGQDGTASPESGKNKLSDSNGDLKMDEDQAESVIGVGDLEITPVSAAIARHLGIDLTHEGRAARNRRGIAVIVHGPPMSGKTNTAVFLAKNYGAARMTVDGIVLEAISNGNTQAGLLARQVLEDRRLAHTTSSRQIETKESSQKATSKQSRAGLKARELCALTARGLREEDAETGAAVAGGLSVEAVTAHAATGPSVAGTDSKIGGASVISTKKTSVISKQAHSTMGSKAGGAATMSEHTGSHVPSSPPPLAAPIARRLSVSASVAGEEGLVSCVLPEDLLVEILAERLQLNDCHQGVVFDGLETLFSPNLQATALAVLKAINNRKHIYFISQKLDYNNVRERQKAKEEESAKTAEEEEEQKRTKLDDMDEDDYDALSEEEKERIENKMLEEKKQRRRREAIERQERERIERERMALMEERRLEEENLKKKGRKGKREETGKRSISGNKEKGGGGLKTVVSLAMAGHTSSHDGLDKARPESRTTDRPESIPEESKKGKKQKARPVSDDEMKEKASEEAKEELSEEEKELQQRFKAFDVSLRDINHVLTFWDRTQLIVNRPATPEGTSQTEEEAGTTTTRDKAPPSGRKGSKKERERERLEREKAEKEKAEKEKADRERMEKEKADREKQQQEGTEQVDGSTLAEDLEKLGVPHLQLDANDPENPCCKYILDLNKLPSVDEVLDGLGLGPKGPPVPPPAIFSVVPYPVKRKPPNGDPLSHYEFIASSPDDPNIGMEEQASKESEAQLEEQSVPELPRSESKKEDHPPPSSRKGKKERSESVKNAGVRKSSPRRSRRGSIEGRISPPVPQTPGSEADQSSVMGESTGELKILKLSHFRWVVPAHSETVIRIRFTSEDLGQFDQTLSFEITGTRRRYQLFCRGVCSFPTISREPRVVFPHRRKSRARLDDMVMKKYLIQEEMFEFGPLLCGKTRERYKEGKYLENREKINIMNTSPLPAQVSFCFQHDSNATTFLLDPPNMSLEPNEVKELSIWAYPKVAGRFSDVIVCCVRENPEPICFHVACHGVRPELELDRKHLHFDKVLLHRKDTRTLYLRNSSMLPVAWRIAGMENMGDDFSLNQDSGIIEPRCEFALQLHFRATKAMNIKKTIRLEVSDAENIMGLVQADNIQVTAEAYDVALDMSFPKGADGGLDFGTIRVMDESKQTCSLKNKGKYDIGFNFLFDKSAPNCPPIDDLFSVLPQKGTLIPNDRPTQVQVIFRSRTEVTIRDLALLKCHVIEPNIGDGREVIASIPIRLAVRSLFSKYAIFPSNDINFGPMVINTKKTRTFTIENKGEFDFKYTITKMIREAPAIRPRPMVLAGKRAKSREGSSSSRSIARVGRAASIRQDLGTNQTRLLVGSFTIYPGFGTILPSGVQNITIDNVSEGLGRSEEFLSIDISDRDPLDNASGIPYRVLAEGCIPSINTSDVCSIFEEHRICRNLSVYTDNKELLEGSGVFGEEDNRFMFCNVIVGRKAYARFKVLNTNKVPVDVTFSVKPISNKVAARIHDIFELEITRTQIAPHNFVYATVSFAPPAMNNYMCNFEAAVEGVPTSVRGRNLFFEISGEGNLPRVSVEQPLVRNKLGEPLLVFQRLLLARREVLPLVIKNDGTFPSKINLVLEQMTKQEDEADSNVTEDAEYSAFTSELAYSLVPTAGTQTCVPMTLPGQTNRYPYTASVILAPDEVAKFDVIFKPMTSRVYHGRLRVSVVDNQFEEHKVQLYGEGFKDDITIDNLLRDGDMAALAGEDGVIDTDVLPQRLISDPSDGGTGIRGETLFFGEGDVGVPKDRTFTLSNHSGSDTVRFLWNQHLNLKFVPTAGHLHPGCSKEVTVTFKSDKPAEILKSLVKCNITKIKFIKPIDQVTDWDDRMRTVKWVNVSSADPTKAGSRPAKKKVVETEPEPGYTVAEESARQLELFLSANVGFAKFKSTTSSISFKDTLMFQSRVFEFDLSNEGKIGLEYNWQLVLETPSLRDGASAVGDMEGRPSTATHSARSAGSSLRSLITDEISGLPFSIAPSEGKIQAGKKETFFVRFSPYDVTEYQARLLCSIPNLEPGLQGPTIKIKGRSLMPYCHFDLEDSDYISNSRRNPDLAGPGGAPPGMTLDPNTRVIEFNSIGIDNKNVKKFWIMNPTASTYSFQWFCDDVTDARVPSNFTCNVTRGQLLSGKKLEMSFEFKPRALEISESFWKFVILEQNISIPFLLVGHTHEPSVSLNASHLNFKSILLGHIASETLYLVNNESIGFNYDVTQSSCYSEAYSTNLDISPMKGFVDAKSRIPLQVSYQAKKKGDANFNVTIKVMRKTKPLTLNVKASGHSMSAQLLCENSQGIKVELSPVGLNAINLGEVEIRENAVRQLHLVNSGKHNFNYTCVVKQKGKILSASEDGAKPKKKAVVNVTPSEGAVASGSRKRCLLTFKPNRLGAIPVVELMLKVIDGPTYLCHVSGSGVNPGIEFSFDKHDFGACFIYRAGMPTNSATMTITNKDSKEISVECLYQNTNYLNVAFGANVLAPGANADAVITFYPRDAISYKEVVKFQVNGLSTHGIELKGEGTEMRVEVANPRQKLVKFGALRVGQATKHIVPIVNRSPTPITLTLSATPESQPLQNGDVLRVLPSEPVTLPGKGGSRDVEVYFTPKSRIPCFTEEIMMECADLSQPIFIVSGSCQGVEINLDQDSIPFGAVVQGSQSEKRFVMYNTGDIGAGFQWDAEKFAPDFSVSPVRGYISPGMEVSFTLTFHPRELSQDIRYEDLKCKIEGGKPLKFTLTGMCIGTPPSKEVQTFNCHVRGRDVRSIMIPNRSNQRWTLRPLIDGDYWTGADTLVVDAQQSRPYEITYRPLTMTTDGKKHQGTVFFPLPDGSGLLYNLLGHGDPPKPVASVSRDVPCKTAYVELLNVGNWLRKPQRFKVSVEMIKPDRLDAGTTLKGLDYIDVPGSMKRDYKLNFYAHKEGTFGAKIVFKNERTNEYLFYYVTLRATTPGVMGTIELETPVRRSAIHTLRVENPLSYPLTFQTECKVADINLPPQFTVPPNSEGTCMFEYQPLKVGESSGKLTLSNGDLGNYTYDLALRSSPAVLEKTTHFKTWLGNNHVVTIKFQNYARQKTDYICKVNSNEWSCERSITAAPASSGSGTEVTIDVTYEPMQLGDSQAILTVTSSIGGEYLFPLEGKCLAPRPQGPFVVRNKSSVSVLFRNVFPTTTVFTFQVDNPLFTVKPGEAIRSKKTHNISVGFDGATSPGSVITGKLTLSCVRSAGQVMSWVYYLKGITPEHGMG
ncbi:hydrocephalus-inducing protein homolog isoform X2 [Clavelina lepadiformis]|uniref:hydrocephalus-inducing protein homolog isoform X2 n=1 Tax=Clavelina lepadiformis TaxID=159417 RepID=UPI00404322F5